MTDRLRLDINLNAITHNLHIIKNLIKLDVSKIIAVIKSDAYGHGLVEIAKHLVNEGVEFFAVANSTEAFRLIEDGISSKILILGFEDFSNIEKVVELGCIQAVSTLEMACKLSQKAVELKKITPIHLKIDTGLGRLGLNYEESLPLIRKIISLPNICVEGIFTQLAAQDLMDISYQNQVRKFEHLIKKLKEENIEIPIIHISNSSGILRNLIHTSYLVRPGALLYGLNTFGNKVFYKYQFKEALTLSSKVICIKTLKKGDFLGYSNNYQAKKDTVVATIPVGFADGYPRRMSNHGYVLIKERRVPIIGTIYMNHLMIDITDMSDIHIGEEVVLIGRQGKGFISINDIALKCATIDTEILCNISKEIPRIYNYVENQVYHIGCK
ncbi:alanine racemase [Bacillus sp. NA_146.1]